MNLPPWFYWLLLLLAGILGLPCPAQAQMLGSAPPLQWQHKETRHLWLAGESGDIETYRYDKVGYQFLKTLRTTGIKAVAMDLVRLADESVPVPVVLAEDGIYRYTNTGLMPLVKAPHLYQQSPHWLLSTLRDIRFSMDLDENGLSDFILPYFGQLTLLLQQQDGSFQRQQVKLEHTYALSTHQSENYALTISLPAHFALQDINQDKHMDLTFVIGEQIFALKRTEAGFSDNLQSWSFAAADEDKSRQFGALLDATGDGIIDVLVKESGEGDSHRILVFPGFLNPATRVWQVSDTAAAIVKMDDELLHFGYGDFNGDGRPDLYSVSASVGLSSVLSLMSDRVLELDFNLYLQGNDGQFKRQRRASKTLHMALDLRQMSQDWLFRVTDINNDGLSDLIFFDDEQNLMLCFGERKTGLSRRSQPLALSVKGKPGKVVLLNNTGQTSIWFLQHNEQSEKVYIKYQL
ncbi:FG-GAP repeat domain-containing protein [Pseudoalteromonas rubra]|nr:VCBS repeat-containing protein [Pseudoalteromonas rubra]